MTVDYVIQSDIYAIDHFLIDRGDIERWSEWVARKTVIEKEFPELIAAIKAYEVAERTLNRVAGNIVDNAYQYPEA